MLGRMVSCRDRPQPTAFLTELCRVSKGHAGAPREGPSSLLKKVGQRTRLGVFKLASLSGPALLRGTRSTGFDFSAYFEKWVLLNTLIEQLRSLRINCVLDIGANEGNYRRLLRAIGYRGEIYCFEPVAAPLVLLRKASSRDTHTHILEMALGSHDATMPIIVSKDTLFSSFLQLNEFAAEQFPLSASCHTEMVPVRRLDSVLGECIREIPNPRIFMKVDTQGFDLEVLEGARGCLDKILGLQIELSEVPIYKRMPDFNGAVTYIKGLGFDIAGLVPVARDACGRLIEFDCIAVRSREARRV
jgi:FkbM family methyltransferase